MEADQEVAPARTPVEPRGHRRSRRPTERRTWWRRHRRGRRIRSRRRCPAAVAKVSSLHAQPRGRTESTPPFVGITAARRLPIACAWSFHRDANDGREQGQQPGDAARCAPRQQERAQVRVYSRRFRAERADEIRAAAGGVSTLEVVTTAVRDEVTRLEKLREALSEDIVLHGPSTRAGAPRGQLAQRSSVARHLAKLEVTWATAEQRDESGLDDRSAADPTAVAGGTRDLSRAPRVARPRPRASRCLHPAWR